MNWDWDKLQEKRKNHQGWENKTPQKDDEFMADIENNFEEFFNKRKNSQKNNNDNNNKPPHNEKEPKEFSSKLPGAKWIFIILLLVWFGSGIYIVRPDEAGVVLRFGAYNRTETAGLHYHLPYPIESVVLPNVSRVRQAEVGFRSSNANELSFQQGRLQDVDEEGSMLTGDENIVNIKFNIQYNIKPDGAVDYLFNVTQPDAVVKKAAEAAMREVIGKTTLDSALTGGRVEIQDEVTKLLQTILDRYQVGVQVVAVQMQDVQPPKDVQEAFKDVASAREDKQRLISVAEAYRRDILPKAQGAAAEIINKAEAYKQTRIAESQGETTKFLALLAEYEKAKDITQKRILFESLEKMLSNPSIEKMILPQNGMNQIMPLIPMANTPQILPQTTQENITQEHTQATQAPQNTQTPIRPFTRGIR